MRKNKETYPVEVAAEKLFNQVRLSIAKLTNYLTTIPKNKMDRAAWILEIIAFTSLLLAMLLRV